MKIINGIALIEGDTHISKWVLESGRLDHDTNMLPLLTKHINKGDKVLDVGAYIGDHTIFYSRLVGDSGLVYAVEPNTIAYECLEHNMLGKNNVVLHNCFLSDRKENLSIIIPSNNYGMAYTISDDSGAMSKTIDELRIDFDFIKIDAEGYELKILNGAKNLISRRKPKLLIEININALKRYSVSALDIFNFLHNFGYTIKNIYNEQSFNDNQFDIICE